MTKKEMEKLEIRDDTYDNLTRMWTKVHNMKMKFDDVKYYVALSDLEKNIERVRRLMRLTGEEQELLKEHGYY